ncbi:MAG: GNAT family N-acetyltransferase [Candidatus Paceibacterota bacterium]|jgi:ribosomal protein S18 acetylase RimI-like enzyme
MESLNKNEKLATTTETLTTLTTLTTDALIEIIYRGKNLPQDKRFLSKEEGGVFEYSALEGTSINKEDFHFPVIKIGDNIIGLSKLQKDPYKDRNYWIQFLSIDPKYQEKGYASKLAEEIFRFAKQKGYSLETSSYTGIGYLKLKGLFRKLAEKYSVNFIDKGEL